jgi:hypothetical protein
VGTSHTRYFFSMARFVERRAELRTKWAKAELVKKVKLQRNRVEFLCKS